MGRDQLLEALMAPWPSNRNDYGMNSGIPFIKIANRVEVNVSLRWKWVSGPPSSFRTITKESYRSTLNK
jgi:hypothetical protein